MERDAMGKPLILFAPDETTRAMIDMYARTAVGLIPGPIDAAAIDRLRAKTDAAPQSLIVVQLPRRAGAAERRLARYFGRGPGVPAQPPGEPQPPWAAAANLRVAKIYSLPDGRRYALLEPNPSP
jgi:hypothetical protein